jgi:hypothetical protein
MWTDEVQNECGLEFANYVHSFGSQKEKETLKSRENFCLQKQNKINVVGSKLARYPDILHPSLNPYC